MHNRAAVIFKCPTKNIMVDIDVPLDITVVEMLSALNSAYELNIDLDDASVCYLKSENPIALLRGNRLLSEYGIRDGSAIIYS